MAAESTGTFVSSTSTLALIAQAQDLATQLNTALLTSYNTTGTFITGLLQTTHRDKYHHETAYPTPSLDIIVLTNADTGTSAICSEVNAIIQELNDVNVDVSGVLTYGHQDPTKLQTGAPSIELTGITLTFTDRSDIIEYCASTKLPRDAGQDPAHLAVLAQYEADVAAGIKQRPPVF